MNSWTKITDLNMFYTCSSNVLFLGDSRFLKLYSGGDYYYYLVGDRCGYDPLLTGGAGSVHGRALLTLIAVHLGDAVHNALQPSVAASRQTSSDLRDFGAYSKG